MVLKSGGESQPTSRKTSKRVKVKTKAEKDQTGGKTHSISSVSQRVRGHRGTFLEVRQQRSAHPEAGRQAGRQASEEQIHYQMHSGSDQGLWVWKTIWPEQDWNDQT